MAFVVVHVGHGGPHQDGHDHQDVRPARVIERVELSLTDRPCVVNNGECDLLTTPVGGGVDSLDYTCTEPRNITNSGGGGRNYGVESNLNLETTALARAVIRVEIISYSNPVIITC